MAFRTSKIFKALDKHEASTPQTVRDALAGGEDAEMIDSSTGKCCHFAYLDSAVDFYHTMQSLFQGISLAIRYLVFWTVPSMV